MRAKLPDRYTAGNLVTRPLHARLVVSVMWVLDLANLVSLRDEAGILEQLDENHAGDESTDLQRRVHDATSW